MRKLILLLTLQAMFLVVSCSNSNQDVQKRTQVQYSTASAEKLIAEGKTQEAAEHFAHIGELLIIPKGMDYADEMFDKALDLDSKNIRANFYTAIIKPWRALKGIQARTAVLDQKLKDLHMAHGLKKITEKHSPFHTNLSSNAPKLYEYLNFKSQSVKPFQSFDEAQDYIANEFLPVLKKAANQLSDVIAARENFEILIKLADWGKVETEVLQNYQCTRRDEDYGYHHYRNWYCEYDHFETTTPAADRTPTVDSVDLKALRSTYLALIDGLRVLTAYTLTDVEVLAKELNSTIAYYNQRYKGVPRGRLVSIIQRYKNFALLKKNHEIDQISKNTYEIIQHNLDFAALYSELCNPAERKMNLFKLICVADQSVPYLQLLMDMLAGPQVVPIGADKKGYPVEILTDLRSVLANPPSDLKVLLPHNFTREGIPTDFPDPTLGGLFPDGNFLEKLNSISCKKK